MGRVTLDDLWLCDAPDGTPPSSSARRSLGQSRDPFRARVPDRWRSARYGRGARWRCRWTQSMPDGTRRQRTRSFDRLEDAQEFQAAMEDDIRRGRYHDPRQEDRLLADVAREWLDSKIDLRDSTRARYRRELRVYVLPRWGATPLRGIVGRDLQQWVIGLASGDYPADLPQGRRPRPLRPRTIRSIVRIVMAGVLSYARRQGWMVDDPLDGVMLPRIVDRDDDRVYLDVSEVESLADECAKVGDAQDGLMVRTLALTGMRVGELLSLQVGDVDLERMRIRVARTWTDDGHGGQRIGPPKNGKARWAAYPALLADGLRGQCEGHGDDEWLFRAPRGGPIWLHNWRSRVWRPAVRALGLDDVGVTIHSLRHTYASLAIAAGADVKTLQSQLGHSSAAVTLDVYASLWPDRLDDVAQAVGDMVSDGLRRS